MRKEIARFEWVNGRFGNNVAWIARVADGWTVGLGYSDPFFFRRVVDAKRYFRGFCAKQEAA